MFINIEINICDVLFLKLKRKDEDSTELIVILNIINILINTKYVIS
jgi:hypothetical protein